MGARRTPPLERRHRQRRRTDRLRSFLLDWHTGATAVISILSAALLIGVLSAATDRANAHRDARSAINALESRQRKIDQLATKIDGLDAAIDRLRDDRAADRAEVARLTAERDALQQQLVNMRARPVVPITTTTSTRPPPTTTTRPPTTSTTTSSTSTTICRVNLLGRCIGGTG